MRKELFEFNDVNEKEEEEHYEEDESWDDYI